MVVDTDDGTVVESLGAVQGGGVELVREDTSEDKYKVIKSNITRT